MQRNQPNIDGFVVRRRSQNSNLARPRHTLDSNELPSQYLIDPSKPRNTTSDGLALARPGGNSTHAPDAISLPKPKRPETIAVDMSLDGESNGKQPPTGKKSRMHKWPRKRIIKWILIALAVILLAVGAWFAYKFISTGGKIFKGNVITALFNQGKELKKDANGRSNILLFGTSEDDPGHDAPDLTDSMMIASISQDKKDAFLVSVPRDLYIDYGRACAAGYKGKINSYYSCIKEAEGEEAGRMALAKKVGEVFGLDMQYVVQVNYKAMRDAVDAIGGITVNIESTDPRGILDRNFDWDCPRGVYTCYNVKYPNGPAQLNGKQALYLARARGANGITYGLSQANFDREGYQRKIIIAIKDKAVSAGTLTNPVAVNNLLDTLGNNVRTNFDADEVKTLVRLGQEIKSENIKSIVLNDPEAPLVTTGNAGGVSIVQPTKGLYNYSEIQAVIKAYATGDTAALEKAKIDVLNASGQSGAAQAKANIVTENGLRVGIVGNAPSSADTAPIQIIDLSEGKKSATLKKLESVFKVKASTNLPAGVTSAADIVIIVGKTTTSSANPQ